MGDVRYERPYSFVQAAPDRVAAIRSLSDEEVIAALAAASRRYDAILANILATEAQNRAARNQRVLEGMADGLLVLSWPETTVVYANPAAERMFGLGAGALADRDLAALVADGDDVPALLRRIEEDLPSQRALDAQVLLRRADGADFPAEVTFTLPRSSLGEVTGVVTVVRDISDRRRDEAGARRAGALLEALVENTDDAMFVKDLEGRYVFVNDAGAAFVGKRPRDVLGTTDLDHVDPRTAEAVRATDREVSTTRRWRVSNVEVELGGVPRVFSVRKGPLVGPDGEVVGVVGIARDVSERKRVEHAKELWEELFQNAAWGIALATPDGARLEVVNPAFAAMHGRSVDELVGRPVLDVLSPDEGPGFVDRFVSAGDARSVHQVTHVRKDGTTFPAVVEVTTVKDIERDARFRAINVQDVTEQRAAERRLATQSAVARILAAATSTQHGIEAVVDTFCQTLSWDVGEYWRLDPRDGSLHLAYGHYPPQPWADGFRRASAVVSFSKDRGLPGIIWAAKRALGISNVAADPAFVRREEARLAGLRAGFGMLVGTSSRTFGVMTFLSPDMRFFDEDLREAMESIGRQVGQFIERGAAERRLRRVLEMAPSPVLVVDPSGLVLAANRAAANVLGRRPHEVVGARCRDLLPGDAWSDLVRESGGGWTPLDLPGGAAEVAAVERDEDPAGDLVLLFRPPTRVTERARPAP